MRFKTLLLVIFLTNVTLSVFAQVNTSDFNSLISDCRKIIQTSKEGTSDGCFRPGSKEEFNTFINNIEVKGLANINQQSLDSLTDILHNAYLEYTKKRYGIIRPLQSDNYWETANVTSKWGPYNLHDPSIIQTKGYFYVYGTDAAWAQTVKGIPYRRSRDLVNWEYLGTVFNNSYPAKNNYWMDSLSGEPGHTQTGIWAPYILKVKDEYRLYYCSIHAPNGAVICLAVSQSPRGPWTQRGSIVYYKDNGGMMTNAIDPTITTGKDRRQWMAWGSWSQGLYITELDTLTGLKKKGASETLIAKNRPQWNGTHSSMEGPEIIYNPKTGYYYLFVAEGDLGTIYQTRVARSIRPEGPYVDYSNNAIIYSTNKDLYPLLSYAYKFNNHTGWQGVAHCGVVNVNGQYFMLNQGRPSSVPSMMDLHVKKIYWTENGWPVISPERYANPGIMPEINNQQLAGNWEEIILNENKSGGISNDLPDSITKANPVQFQCRSVTLTLNSDGTISPTGSWNYDGNYLTLAKGGYTYKVSVDWEWDWENGCPTLIYTGLRSDGRTYWGKKSIYQNILTKNIISNSSFDEGSSGYTFATASGNVNTSILTATNNPESIVNGNTFQAIINSKPTNYWDQGISWKFPAVQGARYKVSLKYRITPTGSLNAELQEASKDNTALYRAMHNLTSSTAANTLEFITNDVSLTDPSYTLNLQYGSNAAGTKIQLDDISILDLSNQWDGNYIVNGGFEYGTDSWYISKISSSLTMGISDTLLLSGRKSYSMNLTTSLSNSHLLNRLYWKAYLLSGKKYRLTFDATGTGSVDAYLRTGSTDATQTVSDLFGESNIQLSELEQNYTINIPAVTNSGEYTISFSPRKQGSVLLDNIRLEIINDTAQSVPSFVTYNELLFYPNPCKGQLFFNTEKIGSTISIYSIQGKCLLNKTLTTNILDLSGFPNGIYILQSGLSKKQKLVLQK